MQHIHRRTLLKTVTASLIAPAIMSQSRQSRAAAPKSPLYGVQAVYFDGHTVIRNDGTLGLNGAQNPPPTSSRYFAVLYRYNSTVLAPTLNQTILQLNAPNSTYPVVQISHGSQNGKRGTGYLSVSFANGAVNVGMIGESAVGSLPYDGKYHLVAVFTDTNAGTVIATLDNKIISSFARKTFSGSFSMPFYTDPYGTTLAWTVGNMVSYPAYYTGNLAQLYGIIGQPIDLTNPSIQNSFTDPTTGLPVRNASDGSIPVFDSNGDITQTLQAQIYLSGGDRMFLKNIPGWKFATFNDFMNISPGSKYVPATDPGPSSFYTAGGVLQTATIDPWGFTGET